MYFTFVEMRLLVDRWWTELMAICCRNATFADMPRACLPSATTTAAKISICILSLGIINCRSDKLVPCQSAETLSADVSVFYEWKLLPSLIVSQRCSVLIELICAKCLGECFSVDILSTVLQIRLAAITAGCYEFQQENRLHFRHLP